MSYRTTVYLPDSYKELLAARPDINLSELTRKAIAAELGVSDTTRLDEQLRLRGLSLFRLGRLRVSDTTGLDEQLRRHEEIVRVLKDQLNNHTKQLAEPMNKIRVALLQTGAISREKLVSFYGSDVITVLVQKGEIFFDENKKCLALTASGREKAKALVGV